MEKDAQQQPKLLGDWVKNQEQVLDDIDENVKRFKSLKRMGRKVDTSEFRICMITLGGKCEGAIIELEEALLVCKRARLLIEEALAVTATDTPS